MAESPAVPSRPAGTKDGRRDARLLDEAFARAAVRARLQEEGGLPRAPRRLPSPRVQALMTYVDAALRRPAPPLAAGWRRRGFHAAAILLARFAAGWPRRVRGWWDLAGARERDHATWLRPPATYVGSPAEDPPVRAALMLRLLGRPAEALAVVRRRLAAGLPAGETRFWAVRFLEEAGEKRAAAALAAAAEPATPAPPAVVRHRPDRLRYAVVMTTLIDTPIFRRSLQSLADSDFSGEIVVVEDGAEAAECCRAACEALGVTYLKCAEWVGSAAAVNAGVAHVADRADIVIFCHNDVLWPPEWFRLLDEAWARVAASGRVALLNLGYLQIRQKTDPTLLGLFLRGRYDDLVWLLRAMRDVPSLAGRVQDAQVKPGEAPFGLARDPWIESVPDLRLQSGRFSVAASFPVRLWRGIGGFDPDLPYAFDLQLLQDSVAHRRWALFVNTPPLVHMKSSDTRAVPHAMQVEVGRKIEATYEAFARKYHWQIEHYLNLYFSESLVAHADDIVEAVNAGRFDDVDWVFDDFRRRLEVRRLDNCELTWCRTRSACPYTAA